MALPNLWQALLPRLFDRGAPNSVCGLLKPLAVILWILKSHNKNGKGQKEKYKLTENFKCGLCSRHFMRYCHLGSHVRWHNTTKYNGTRDNGKIYQCTKCITSFSQLCYLSNHLGYTYRTFVSTMWYTYY